MTEWQYATWKKKFTTERKKNFKLNAIIKWSTNVEMIGLHEQNITKDSSV